MSVFRARPSRSDRITAIAGVTAIYAVLGALLLIRVGTAPVAAPLTEPTVLINIDPPPPEVIAPDRAKAPEEQGAVGRQAEPTPIILPPPRIVVPNRQRLPAAPVAGTGNSPNAGAGSDGAGPGAGGAGYGRGGGGSGQGGGFGENAQLLWGGLNRSDYRWLRRFSPSNGRAVLALLVGPDGRVAACRIRQSSGAAEIDEALCSTLQSRMRWSPERDDEGRPFAVGIHYTATWNSY